MVDEPKPIDIARHFVLSNCSFCGAKEMRTLETRPLKNAMRRRKHCLHCGNRETTYEISQVRYKQLQAIDKISVTATAKVELHCFTCINWAHNKCSMGFPEAGGTFANDCSCYQKD